MRISGLACLLLVVLRLAIGWHFLVEGVWKIRTHLTGPTATNVPWTGEPFFREGAGPIADWYRQSLGISDDAILNRFQFIQDSELVVAEKEWTNYLAELSKHYGLTEDQRMDVQKVFSEHRDPMAAWIQSKTKPVTPKSVAWGSVDVPQTVAQRLETYDSRKAELQEIQRSEQPTFNKPVNSARVRALKTESARILNELNAELEAREAAMKKAVIDAAHLTEDQKKLGSMPEKKNNWMKRLDQMTMWMQAILGGFLVLGLQTRLAAAVLAAFLLQVVLIAPALPFASPAPGDPGHYLIVDMHVIEMLALLVLAAIPTGRWFGLDALTCRRSGRLIEPRG